MKTKRAWANLLCVAAGLAGFLTGCANAQPGQALPAWLGSAATKSVTPGACRVKTDMEMAQVGSISTNYHSRTRLPDYRHVSGGMTPATVRLQGGRGSVQLTPEWLGFVDRINGHNPQMMSYLFHRASGWQNSAQYGRVEELVFEDQWLNVTRVRGAKAFVETYSVGDTPPEQVISRDLRHQLFTVVTRDDQMIGAPSGDATIVLIARPGEMLWIPTDNLDCRSRLPRGSAVQK